MQLNVWFRLHWVDPRLTWNASEWGVSRLLVNNPELRYTDAWVPDVVSPARSLQRTFATHLRA